MSVGAIIALGFWGLFVALLAYGWSQDIKRWWKDHREARQVEALNRAWSIPSREPIRTKLP